MIRTLGCSWKGTAYTQGRVLPPCFLMAGTRLPLKLSLIHILHVLSGELNVYGGCIEGCKAANAANGGAVYLEGGSVLLDGVSITGCEAVNGSAIYVKNGASCTIRGGVIQGNTASASGAVYVENGGELVLSGAPSIQGNTKGNVYLAANTTFTLASDFSAAAKVGVSVAGVDSTTDTQTTFATSATDFFQCFTADADGVVTAFAAPEEGETEGKLVLKKYQHLHPICGDASCTDADHQIEMCIRDRAQSARHSGARRCHRGEALFANKRALRHGRLFRLPGGRGWLWQDVYGTRRCV